MNKRLWFLVMAFVVALVTSSCRHSTDESTNGDNVPDAPVTKEKVLEKIEVIQFQKNYRLHESFTTTGMVVKVTFDDGSSSNEVDFTAAGWSIDSSKFDSSAVSPGQEIIVSYTYKGVTKSASFTVIIYDPDAIKSIAVKGGVGPAHAKDTADFNPLGLVVEMTLDDGSDTVISVSDFSDPSKWTFTGFDASAVASALPMTVTYHKSTSEEFTADFTINIYDPDAVKSIAVKTGPFIDTYDCKADESEFKWQGLVVEMTLDDGNDTVVSVSDFSDAKWVFSGWDSTTPTDALTMTITYSSTLSDTFTIKIKDVMTGISITAVPTQTDYIIGETLDITGLAVTVNYISGHTEVYDADHIRASSDWEYNIGFNTGNAADDLSITVRYSDNGKEIGRDTFSIAVYNIDSVTIPAALQTPAATTFFEEETETFFRSNFVKDSNLMQVGLKAEVKTSSRDIPLTDSIFTVSLSGNGFDAATQTFVESTNTGTDAALATVSVTLNSITREASVPLIVKSVYKFHSDLEKFTGTLPGGVSVLNDQIDWDGSAAITCTVTDQELKFVTFGDYPQSIAKIEGTTYGKDLHIYEIDERKKSVGGMDMYLGSDGGYYVKVANAKKHTDGNDTRYDFDTGAERGVWNGKTCWFKVEPLLWRVLDTDYKGTGTTPIGALLWSVKAVERMPFFADSYSPDDGNSGEFIGGGKSPRTINGVSVKWNSYKYSTLRAFLRGEYEPGDEQADTSYKQIFTGKDDTEVLLEKFNVNGEKRGFLQRAFDKSALSYLKQVDLGEDMNDYVFVLSKDELMNPAPEYYFISEAQAVNANKDSQQHRAKNPTHYTMAREAKRWSTSNDGVTFSYPGTSVWTRTSSTTGIHVVSGFGNAYHNGSDIGRGAFKDGAVAPAICVESTAITTLFP